LLRGDNPKAIPQPELRCAVAIDLCGTLLDRQLQSVAAKGQFLIILIGFGLSSPGYSSASLFLSWHTKVSSKRDSLTHPKTVVYPQAVPNTEQHILKNMETVVFY